MINKQLTRTEDGSSWAGIKVAFGDAGDYVLRLQVDNGTVVAAIVPYEQRWDDLEAEDI